MKFQFFWRELDSWWRTIIIADNDVTPHPLTTIIVSPSPSLSVQTLQTKPQVNHDTGICITEFFPLNLFANKIKFDGVVTFCPAYVFSPPSPSRLAGHPGFHRPSPQTPTFKMAPAKIKLYPLLPRVPGIKSKCPFVLPWYLRPQRLCPLFELVAPFCTPTPQRHTRYSHCHRSS